MASEQSIPYRILGNTGEKVSIIGLGGAHIGHPYSDKEAIEIVRTAIDNGITFMDNSWDYHEGKSESRMGLALQNGYRNKVFLMTKIDGRTRQSAAMQLDESLRRLKTDVIDLLQFHEIIRMNDPDRIFASGGALETVLAAKKAGKVRYIGFTGHKSPAIHLKMLQVASDNGFTFDTVQMPLNVMDAHFDSFEQKVLPVLLERKIGVLGMKPLCAGIPLQSGVVTAPECLRYALSLPVSVVITGCDSLAILKQAIEVAMSFSPLDPEERAALLARTARAASDGRLERYKTDTRFDSTSYNPQWLG